MKCVIHIGMHKTGSSSIQETLSEYKDDRFEYLNLIAPNHSAFMMTLFGAHPENYHAHQKAGRTPQDVAVLKKEYEALLRSRLEQATSDTVIISGEDLSHPGEPDCARRLKQYLDAYCGSYRVMGYVRNPVSFMQSAFQQRVKGGLGLLKFPPLYPGYRSRFEKYDEVFGKDNVELIDFSRDTLIGGDVVTDFCWRLGIPSSEVAVSRVNESLSLEATSLLFAYRRFGMGYGAYPGAPADNERVIQKLRSIGTSKVKFDPAKIGPVLAKNQKDLAWVSERVGVDYFDVSSYLSEGGVGSDEELLRIAADHVDALRRLVVAELEQQEGAEGVSRLVEAYRLLLTGRLAVTRKH